MEPENEVEQLREWLSIQSSKSLAEIYEEQGYFAVQKLLMDYVRSREDA